MSTKEAATYLGVAEKTIYRWIESGKLPRHKLGIQHFIPRAAVEGLAVSRQSTPPSDQEQRILDMEHRMRALFALIEGMTLRIDHLEQELHDIRIVYASRLLDTPQTTPHSSPEPRQVSVRAIRHTEYIPLAGVPSDTIPLHVFAERIGVHRRTLSDYVIAHGLEHIAVEDGKRTGTMHRYVTPAQQEGIKRARGIY